MFLPYSVGFVVSMYLTSARPRFFWAHCTPSQADWLKLLSSTLPTSVTRPTRSGFEPAPAAAVWLGQPELGAPAAPAAAPAAGVEAAPAAGAEAAAPGGGAR